MRFSPSSPQLADPQFLEERCILDKGGLDQRPVGNQSRQQPIVREVREHRPAIFINRSEETILTGKHIAGGIPEGAGDTTVPALAIRRADR